MLTQATWISTARDRLLALRSVESGWGYRPQSASAVEPSTLASLALLACRGADSPTTLTGARDAARWIANHCRRGDGSTTVAAHSAADTPGWTTPFALLLWNALGGFEVEQRGAVAWLLTMRGKGYKPVPYNPMGHDVSLIGWPWVADTHSWVEPTATTLLALAPSVPNDHPRVVEGVRLLIDRAISTGGWNLGNPVVFGQTFRPLPGPTGLALLALARVGRQSCPEPVIHRALAYVRSVIQQTTAPTSLGWAVLGLRAWEGVLDPTVTGRLELAANRILARGPAPVELAMLLLASGERSLDVLGLNPPQAPETAR